MRLKLRLDYTQRLNLHALIGSQRCSVDDLRAYWKLQDKIDLTAEEKKEIDYKIIGPENQPTPTWRRNGAAPREYEFSTEEFGRVKKVLKEWQQGFVAAPDRIWMEPLLDQLDECEKPSPAV